MHRRKIVILVEMRPLYNGPLVGTPQKILINI